MDYLLNKVLTKVPEPYMISCYYIIDQHLKFVSLKDVEYFYFHYVDSYKVGELIFKSANEYEFDSYVLKTSKPIILQRSYMEKDTDIRIVEVTSRSGNPMIIKKKQEQPKKIITRYQSNGKKLF